ncbi:MAG: hypothetical protein U9Q80_08150 [Bacillota bacterium]|nr:hypothetical protein [Bacillota bacterium]
MTNSWTGGSCGYVYGYATEIEIQEAQWGTPLDLGPLEIVINDIESKVFSSVESGSWSDTFNTGTFTAASAQVGVAMQIPDWEFAFTHAVYHTTVTETDEYAVGWGSWW